MAKVGFPQPGGAFPGAALLAGMAMLGLTSCGLLPEKSKKDDATAAAQTKQGGNSTVNGPAPSADQMIPGVAPDGAGASDGNAALTDFAANITQAAQNQHASLKGWDRSAMDAVEKARDEDKPLLVVAANHDEPSRKMTAQLLLASSFIDATQGKYVLLYVDYDDPETSKSDFYVAFKKRLHIHSYPTLVVTLPDGREVDRYHGYSDAAGSPCLYLVKHAPDKAARMVEDRHRSLQAQGYRMWTDTSGKKVFARLDRVDANQLSFTNEWGQNFTSFVNRMSVADQAWLVQKKESSGG